MEFVIDDERLASVSFGSRPDGDTPGEHGDFVP